MTPMVVKSSYKDEIKFSCVFHTLLVEFEEPYRQGDKIGLLGKEKRIRGQDTAKKIYAPFLLLLFSFL